MLVGRHGSQRTVGEPQGRGQHGRGLMGQRKPWGSRSCEERRVPSKDAVQGKAEVKVWKEYDIFRKLQTLEYRQELRAGVTGGEASESEREVTQSCPTLCDPMDCSLPGSSIHGIFQSSVLEWVAISFSRVSNRPRDGTQVSRIARRRFTS